MKGIGAMEQGPGGKSSLAWFKLAEFVSRGERERALSVYRLLMHTVDDPAFAKQLEGDLLGSFEQPGAFDSYMHAIELYRKNNKTAQAMAICEQVVGMAPHQQFFLDALIELYQESPHSTRIYLAFGNLLAPLVKAHQTPSLVQALRALRPLLAADDALELIDQAKRLVLQYDDGQEQCILIDELKQLIGE